MTSKLALSNFSATKVQIACFSIHIRMTFPLVENISWLQSHIVRTLCHCIHTLFASSSSLREPTRTLVCFLHPLCVALHCSIANPCLSFHFITFVKSKLTMEGPQSTNPFVLQAFQLFTFTAPAPLTCFVFRIHRLLFACHKRF